MAGSVRTTTRRGWPKTAAAWPSSSAWRLPISQRAPDPFARRFVATGPWNGAARPKADAIVTQSEGLAIGVTTADCGPILFVDPNARVIGAAHAGWKGALTGVLELTIDAMEKLGADRTRTVAAIGPLIRQPSYEVGIEFVERFINADAENALFFLPGERDGHAMFDLAGFIRMRLEDAGVLMIDDLGVDTYSDERFYSLPPLGASQGSRTTAGTCTRSCWSRKSRQNLRPVHMPAMGPVTG